MLRRALRSRGRCPVCDYLTFARDEPRFAAYTARVVAASAATLNPGRAGVAAAGLVGELALMCGRLDEFRRSMTHRAAADRATRRALLIHALTFGDRARIDRVDHAPVRGYGRPRV